MAHPVLRTRLKRAFAIATFGACGFLAGEALRREPAKLAPPPESPSKTACLAPGAAAGTDAQRRLLRLLREAGSTPSAEITMDFAARAGMKTCFDEALDKDDVCGYFKAGTFRRRTNELLLNPGSRLSEEDLVITALHEARHKNQDGARINPSAPGNVREHERVILEWFTEADARMATIVFAHEKARLAGDGRYIQALRRSDGEAPMLIAFERALARNPADMPAAMRAAVLAFPEMRKLARSYANGVADWIDREGRRFDPAKPADTILGDESLATLGSVPPYGHYIDAKTRAAIRRSFTEADYRELTRARARSGGTKGAACEPPAPPG